MPTTRNQWKKLNTNNNKITTNNLANQNNSNQQTIEVFETKSTQSGEMMFSSQNSLQLEFEPQTMFNQVSLNSSLIFNDQPLSVAADDCFVQTAPSLQTEQSLPIYQANNSSNHQQQQQIVSYGFADVSALAVNDEFDTLTKNLVSNLRNPNYAVVMTEQSRNDNMALLAQYSSGLNTLMLSPPQTPRSRADSFELCRQVPVASPAASIGYSDGETSYPPSPVQQQQFIQQQDENPMVIFDQVLSDLPIDQPLTASQNFDLPLIASQEFDIDDLLGEIDFPVDTNNVNMPMFGSQESFSSQTIQAQDRAEEAKRQQQQYAQAQYQADILAKACAQTIELSQVVSQDDFVDFANGVSLEDIDEILSNASSSPRHSMADDVHTLPASSPSHSTMSAFELSTDPDYEPSVAGSVTKKSNRGRKRKSVDSDISERDMAKKQKNASAAARYREKQKQQNATVDQQLAAVEAQHEIIARKFNAKLTERNFMLKLVFEAHEKNINGLGARKFPDWVDAWFRKQRTE